MLNNSLPKWQIVKYNVGSKIPSDKDTLYLIKQGMVKVFTYDLEGKTIILGYWGTGDVIGQIVANFDPYEIECMLPVEVAAVPYQDWHYLTKEIRNCFQDLEKFIYILAQKNIEDKLLELLIYFADKFGIPHQSGKEISFPLTHKNLSQLLGTTRVSITRSLNSLQTKKYIEKPQRGKIVLRVAEIPRLKYKI